MRRKSSRSVYADGKKRPRLGGCESTRGSWSVVRKANSNLALPRQVRQAGPKARSVVHVKEPALRAVLFATDTSLPVAANSHRTEQAEAKKPTRRGKLKWPKSNEAEAWRTLDTDLVKALESSLHGGVESKLNQFGDILYQACSDRLGEVTSSQRTIQRESSEPPPVVRERGELLSLQHP